jgi:hypothetical protein
MQQNYSPPEGFEFDPSSGLYYNSTMGSDPETGKAVQWVTWFNASSGEYTQNSYPVEQPQPEPVSAPAPVPEPVPAPAPEPAFAAAMPAAAVIMPVTAPPKKKKTAAILCSVIAAVILLGGGGFAMWHFDPFEWFSDDEPAFSDRRPAGDDNLPADLYGEGVYEGALDEDGLRSGHGVWTFHNFVYEGNWEADLPNGFGRLYMSASDPEKMEPGLIYVVGTVVQGRFEDGYAQGVIDWIMYMDNGETNQWTFLVEDGRHTQSDMIFNHMGYGLEPHEDSLFAVPPFAPEVGTAPDLPAPDIFNPQPFPLPPPPEPEPAPEINLWLDNYTFDEGEAFSVYVEGITREMQNAGAFVAIYEAHAPHDAYMTWAYPHEGNNVFYFTAPHFAGDFEIRLYSQDFVYDEETFVTSVLFTVRQPEIPVSTLNAGYYYNSDSGMSYGYLSLYNFDGHYGDFYMEGNFTGDWGMDTWAYFRGYFIKEGDYIYLYSDGIWEYTVTTRTRPISELVFYVRTDGHLSYAHDNFGFVESGALFYRYDNHYDDYYDYFDYPHDESVPEAADTPWG